MDEGYYDHSRREALNLLPACPRKVLDIGCGRGGVSRELKRRCPGVESTGLDVYLDPDYDYSEIFAHFDRVDLESEEPPVDVAGFDLILLLDVLEHLRSPQEVLARLVERASPETLFLVSLPNFHYYSNLAQVVRSGRFAYADDGILDRTHLRFFGFEDARRMLAGLLEVERTLMFNPFANLKSRLVELVFGKRYGAYQNIFLCRKASGAR